MLSVLNALKLLFKSPAFYTALVGVISGIIMYYALVPKEIWILVEALLVSIFAVFTGNEVAKAMGDRVVDGMREMNKQKSK